MPLGAGWEWGLWALNALLALTTPSHPFRGSGSHWGGHGLDEALISLSLYACSSILDGMRKLTLLMFAFVLGACATPPTAAELDDVVLQAEPTPEQAVEAIKAIMLDILKDPDSAKYRVVKIGKGWMTKSNARGSWKSIGWRVDVQINGKNSYGAYIGYQLHHFILDDQHRVLRHIKASHEMIETGFLLVGWT